MCQRPEKTTGTSRNELSGVVHGSAVQAGNIHGGVHFSVTRSSPVQMPVPAQLPPATAYFSGRSGELRDLQQAADECDPVRRLAVVVISGTGGAGKTSLATYWLHSISAAFDGGALYADLRGHAPEAAAPPGEVLTGFLSALGVPPDRIPVELSEQAKLYRSLTSGRRMLVLLDNAATAAQVRALLPGPGPRQVPEQPELPTLVVVTTRWRIAGLALDGARFIELGPLDDQAGTELLGHMVGAARAAAETDAVRSVVRLCGGLPLAVCAAGARLAAHLRWPVGRVAAELASEKDRLAALTIGDDLSVRAAFDVSYQALPIPAARLYRMLSLVPGHDFGSEIAAATAELPAGQAAALLDELATASLLEEAAEQRFRFHDLVRLHARERADAEPEQLRRAATARAIGWYLAKAVAADIVIIPGRRRLNPMYERARAAAPGFAGPPDALRWAESELPGLVAAVHAAHDQHLDEQTWQLCEALWGLFTYRKYFRYWIQTHLAGIDSARTCGNRRAEARVRTQLGLAYLNLGRHDEARQEFLGSLALDRQEGHALGEASALENLGLTELSLGRSEAALGSFLQARDIYSQNGYPRGIMAMTRHIGEAHRDAGRHDQAVRNLLEARRMAAALPDAYNEARCLTSLGQAHLQAGEHGSAVDALSEALMLMVRLDGRYEQARIGVLLADALLGLGQPSAAREHLARSLAIYSGIDAPETGDIRHRLAELGPS
ncbi:MAG TPA: tetratricopeptide repeat protein [Streptosporangiaceae bacterium]|nr:tetratricopeptide repeat protein [Streptosporangiaceae bacterium]